MEIFAAVRQRDIVDAVLDLAAVAVVLTFDAGGVFAALGGAGLINAADRLGVGMFASDDLLATVPQPLFIPNDRLQEPLQRSGSHPLVQGDRFGVLSLDIRKQPTNIDGQ